MKLKKVVRRISKLKSCESVCREPVPSLIKPSEEWFSAAVYPYGGLFGTGTQSVCGGIE